MSSSVTIPHERFCLYVLRVGLKYVIHMTSKGVYGTPVLNPKVELWGVKLIVLKMYHVITL